MVDIFEPAVLISLRIGPSEIDALGVQLKKAWAAGDVDKLLSHYTDDCKAIYSDVPGCKEGKARKLCTFV